MGDICAACVEDDDIKARILAESEEPGCHYCGEDDAPTMDFEELADFIRKRLLMFWSLAIEELLYDDESESGYGGETWTTEEILFDEVALELPRDADGSLRAALVTALGEEPWCDLDPARLPANQAMVMDWEQFARRAICDGQAVMDVIDPDSEYDDSMPPGLVLPHLASTIGRFGLVAIWPAGYRLFRARPRDAGQHFSRPSDLGPPPVECATQSNRMNPIGDPMLYGAERATTVVVEAGAPLLSIGLFSVEREIRLLDLADLPPAPGMFSSKPADDIQTMWFLHRFASLISLPVARIEGFVPEYVPTQLMTSFLRQHPFDGGPIDGIRYRSAASSDGNATSTANVVLFATDADVWTDDGDVGRRPYLRLLAPFQYPDEREMLAAADDASVRASQRRGAPLVDPPMTEPLPLLAWPGDDDGKPRS